MKRIILDASTIQTEEFIDITNKYKNFDVVKDYMDYKEYTKSYLFYKVIFLTRGNNNTKYTIDGKLYSPIMVKITDDLVWKSDEIQVDAKVRSVEDFISKKIISLYGESYVYNNYIIPSNKETSYIKTTEIYNIIFENDNFCIETVDHYSIGRYFPKDYSNDNLNIYSSKIIKCKYADDKTKMFYKNCLDYFISLGLFSYDLVAYVPCRKNKKDRFEKLCNTNPVILQKDYKETKGLSYDKKMAIMKDCFSINANININNKIILLVDDVLTSSATLCTITRVLYSNGAKKVIWLTFSKNVHRADYVEQIYYTCPKCNNLLAIRFNNDNEKWFVGCTGYPECRTIINNIRFESLDLIYK